MDKDTLLLVRIFLLGALCVAEEEQENTKDKNKKLYMQGNIDALNMVENALKNADFLKKVDKIMK